MALNWTNTVDGHTATNVMHFRSGSGDPATLAAQLDANATNTMWELQPTPAKVTGIVVTPLDGSSVSLPYNPDTPANWTGHGGAGDFVPQVAAIVKLLTAKRGRSYRGRLFLPWVAESQIAQGGINGTSRATATAAWIAFAAAMSADSYDLVVASYLLETADDVVALGVEGYTATQRRRNARNSSV